MKLSQLLLLLASVSLIACSEQNWYQGAQSAQTAECMKQPLSEYKDCNKAAEKSYEQYKSERDQLLKSDDTKP
jgi:pantothenate synthetase